MNTATYTDVVVCPECWTEQPTLDAGMTIATHDRQLYTFGRTMDFEGHIASGSERCPGSGESIPAPRWSGR